MSLMRINYVRNEIKKLSTVIENLIKNYDRDYKKFDSEYKSVKNVLEQKIIDVEKKSDWETHADLIEEETTYLKPIENIKNLAQFQNELILVKHVALIESMIIVLFEHLVYLNNNVPYKIKYFKNKNKFSNVNIAVKKIYEITNQYINIEIYEFWKYYLIMKKMRNCSAHGNILFEMKYSEIIEFNKFLKLIKLEVEINQDEKSNYLYHTLIHPTYEEDSKWYCSVSDNIKELKKLNEVCLDFVEIIRNKYLEYGKENNILQDNLYAKPSI